MVLMATKTLILVVGSCM